eukprot:3464390-Prymnesium_polylepis.1
MTPSRLHLPGRASSSGETSKRGAGPCTGCRARLPAGWTRWPARRCPSTWGSTIHSFSTTRAMPATRSASPPTCSTQSLMATRRPRATRRAYAGYVHGAANSGFVLGLNKCMVIDRVVTQPDIVLKPGLLDFEMNPHQPFTSKVKQANLAAAKLFEEARWR